MSEIITTIPERIEFLKTSINRAKLGETSAVGLTFILTLEVRDLLLQQNELSGITNGYLAKQIELLQELSINPVAVEQEQSDELSGVRNRYLKKQIALLQKLVDKPVAVKREQTKPALVEKKKSWLMKQFNKIK